MKSRVIIPALALFAFVFVLSLYFQTPDYNYFPDKDNPKINNHQSKYAELNKLLRFGEFEKNDYVALNYENQIGVWISYIELSDMLYNSTEESFRKDISAAFDNIKDLGANTVYVHVRAFADAYYPSLMFPYTNAYNDSVPFDALQIMLEEAHVRELSFHAWLNPLRCTQESRMSEISDLFKVKKFYSESFGEKVVAVEESPYLWLNPAYEDVRNYVAKGAAEIASRYDVDAIHIDDYFYPTASVSFDKTAFDVSGMTDLAQWRLSNINRLVLLMNIEIKKANHTVQFEISPQGNINNNYTQMFADVKRWCSEGNIFCDTIIPQVYFGYNSSSPYLDTINNWSGMIADNDRIKLVIGLGVYKIAEESEFKNTDCIISKQIKDAYKLSNVSGVAFYNYSVLFSVGELEEKMQKERDAIQAILK